MRLDAPSLKVVATPFMGLAKRRDESSGYSQILVRQIGGRIYHPLCGEGFLVPPPP